MLFGSLDKLYKLTLTVLKIKPMLTFKNQDKNKQTKNPTQLLLASKKTNQEGLWVSFLLCPGQGTAFPRAFIALANI